MNRTYSRLDGEHLNLLTEFALEEFERFLSISSGKYRVYEEKLIAICLCQGAAQHIVDLEKKTKHDHVDIVSKEEIIRDNLRVDNNKQVLCGIKDIDIWFFFEDDINIKIPNRKNMRKSISVDIPGIGLREIDFLKKGIGTRKSGYSVSAPKESVVKYLNKGGKGGKGGKGDTADFLKKKSIVALYPESIAGDVFWSVSREINTP